MKEDRPPEITEKMKQERWKKRGFRFANNNNPELDKKVFSKYLEESVADIKDRFGQSLTNFEYLRLAKIVRKVLQDVDQTENSRTVIMSTDIFRPRNEILYRWLLEEFDIRPEDIARTEDGVITNDFKKYLKLLREKPERFE